MIFCHFVTFSLFFARFCATNPCTFSARNWAETTASRFYICQSQECQTYGPRTDLMWLTRKFFFMLCMRPVRRFFVFVKNFFDGFFFWKDRKETFFTDPARLRKICLHVAPELKWVWHPWSIESGNSVWPSSESQRGRVNDFSATHPFRERCCDFAIFCR